MISHQGYHFFSLSSFFTLDVVLSVSVKNDMYLFTIVPYFGDHRCQGNNKAMECFDRRIKLLQGDLSHQGHEVNTMALVCGEVLDLFHLLVGATSIVQSQVVI